MRNVLAQAFLEQLSEVLPSGYWLDLEPEMLWIVSPDGGRAGMSSYWLNADVLLGDEVLGGAVCALGQIQQEVAEETTEPWPARSGRDYRGFPEPNAEIIGGELWAWFGTRAEPVLKIGPFDVRDVVLRDE